MSPCQSHRREARSLIDDPGKYKACSTLIYACGLRAGEATTLEIRSIDGVNRTLRIIGKGNKERIVPLPRPVLDGLREFWKTHKNPRWLSPTDPATGRSDGAPLGPFSRFHWKREVRCREQLAETIWLAIGHVQAR
jgi:integrase